MRHSGLDVDERSRSRETSLGAQLTDISEWYRHLRRPSWQPPDWLFGPVWTVILGLAGWSAWLAWHAAPDEFNRTLVVVLTVVNGLANLGLTDKTQNKSQKADMFRRFSPVVKKLLQEIPDKPEDLVIDDFLVEHALCKFTKCKGHGWI